MEGCSNYAFAKCDNQCHPLLMLTCFSNVYSGCGRHLCDQHIEMVYSTGGTCTHYFCKGTSLNKTECGKRYVTQDNLKTLFFLVIFVIIAASVAGAIS